MDLEEKNKKNRKKRRSKRRRKTFFLIFKTKNKNGSKLNVLLFVFI